jgi:SnoaL-like domain
MTEANTSVIEMIHTYYRAYETSDRNAVESMLDDGFTFTSPQDDCIDRDTYFAKCWPNHDHLRSFLLLQVAVEGPHALIRYRCEATDGSTFSNVEHFQIGPDQRITHIDVYFGALPDGKAA